MGKIFLFMNELQEQIKFVNQGLTVNTVGLDVVKVYGSG
jgi:hypothetical protein